MQCLAHRHQRCAGGVQRCVERKINAAVANRADAHDGFVDAANDSPITRALDGVTENIESHTNVADRRRCEGARLFHMRAPSAAAMRSKSANTPAAVTSGPAPGPCTTRGLSQ